MRKKPTIHCLALSTCLLAITTSCVEVRDPNVDGPDNGSTLTVTATSDPATVFEGGSVTLSASANGGTEPIAYRWDQNSGPAVTFASPTAAQTAVSSLTEAGHYVFRITVTDGSGSHESDLVTIDVLAAVTVDAPPYAVVGEPAALSAEVVADAQTPNFLWEVSQGTATIDNPTSATPNLIAGAGETVKVRLTVSFAGDNQPAATRDLDIVAVVDLKPRVRIETNMGDFVIELDGENTPRHMVNFLQYVDEGFYEGLLFHRNACTENATTGECDPFVLQGGGYRREGTELVAVEATHDTIESENDTSASNGELYSVALALRGGNVDSGSTQFFINLNEKNGFLDDSGFTVFGLVVVGTNIVDSLAATDRVESPIIPGEVSLPAEDIVIEQMTRVE